VAIHFHLRPLDADETKEYIRFRLARAGGSGIFLESALDRIYQHTEGVPRRINAWCDLALVAGFAEGRSEMDGDFIQEVIASQGPTLEAEPQDQAPSPLEVEPPAREAVITPPSDGLAATVNELSNRLSRLEGLVLEISSHLLPTLAKLLPRPPAPELDSPPDPLVDAAEDLIEAATPLPPLAPNSKKWWAKLWGK
jgi:hypothetical protein